MSSFLLQIEECFKKSENYEKKKKNYPNIIDDHKIRVLTP